MHSLHNSIVLSTIRCTRYLVAVFIASLWLAEYFREKQTSNYLANFFSGFKKKFQNVYLSVIFGSQTIAGTAFYSTDLSRPFSASKEVSTYILKQKPDTLPIVGPTDYAVSGLSYLLNKPLYYPERKEYGTFIIWDKKRKIDMDFNSIIQGIDTVLQTSPQTLLVLNYQPSYMQGNNRVMLEHVLLTPTIQLDIVKKFENSMVGDEVFYIYIAKRITTN